MRHLPILVTKACYNHEAWIVGSAANPSVVNPRDYDVIIPFVHWHSFASLIPHDAAVNTFGGWKCKEGDTEIDVWPGDLSWILTNHISKFAWHPRSGVRYEKSNTTDKLHVDRDILYALGELQDAYRNDPQQTKVTDKDVMKIIQEVIDNDRIKYRRELHNVQWLLQKLSDVIEGHGSLDHDTSICDCAGCACWRIRETFYTPPILLADGTRRDKYESDDPLYLPELENEVRISSEKDIIREMLAFFAEDIWANDQLTFEQLHEWSQRLFDEYSPVYWHHGKGLPGVDSDTQITTQ